MRRAAHPSGFARCGAGAACSPINSQSLPVVHGAFSRGGTQARPGADFESTGQAFVPAVSADRSHEPEPEPASAVHVMDLHGGSR